MLLLRLLVALLNPPAELPTCLRIHYFSCYEIAFNEVESAKKPTSLSMR